jgi:hypothetical protein
MPYGINVANGTAPSGYTLPGANQPFVWLNYSNTSVQISNCGNWCTPASCTVPAASGNPIVPGQYTAQVLQNPNIAACAFSDTGWNTPGMPHITISPWPTEKNEKEVA